MKHDQPASFHENLSVVPYEYFFFFCGSRVVSRRSRAYAEGKAFVVSRDCRRLRYWYEGEKEHTCLDFFIIRVVVFALWVILGQIERRDIFEYVPDVDSFCVVHCAEQAVRSKRSVTRLFVSLPRENNVIKRLQLLNSLVSMEG